jgi:hypothetical protein
MAQPRAAKIPSWSNPYRAILAETDNNRLMELLSAVEEAMRFACKNSAAVSLTTNSEARCDARAKVGYESIPKSSVGRQSSSDERRESRRPGPVSVIF